MSILRYSLKISLCNGSTKLHLRSVLILEFLFLGEESVVMALNKRGILCLVISWCVLSVASSVPSCFVQYRSNSVNNEHLTSPSSSPSNRKIAVPFAREAGRRGGPLKHELYLRLETSSLAGSVASLFSSHLNDSSKSKGIARLLKLLRKLIFYPIVSSLQQRENIQLP